MIFLLFVIEELQLVGVLLPTVVGLSWFWIGVTYVLSFMISTSGFALQKLVSDATFMVVNNLTKFVNIIIGLFILHDHMGPVDGAGCVIALAAGAWYSAARYHFKASDTEEEKNVSISD
ncbi:GDP-mannose transporter [Trypanosoma rangeli]|uniref:GDP-mannose transporter n=1 Tax=Trypanosoma rangeli TaxID=5698 RepID=A0A3R7M875_TRYRA|nr:GDP-mannose transporter [Trypanosoma rangeli]RNF10867.1 GDP-mannose transporter [Trypanosoma rangeli]|eukprot:RNF10867.1 GDP-mannose transporter [Trypanosoma rangeli]